MEARFSIALKPKRGLGIEANSIPHQTLKITIDVGAETDMSLPPTYKPSPLSYGSPRTSPFKRPESPASPFRRPESPLSPSPGANRPTTPTTTSPTKPQQTPLASPSPYKLQNAPTPPSNSASWTPRGLTPSLTAREPPLSPTRTSSPATTIAATRPFNTARPTANGDALSKLPAAQVREMREGFQILDRDNDGLVNRDDVVDMLTNLGQDASTTATAQFFPPGAPQTLPLPSFLSTLSSLLAPLSSQTELINALAAFDDHDGGEIDVGELKDALLHTAPDPGERGVNAREIEEVLGGFVGRKAFGKEMKGGGGGGRGEVFRYREWVGGLMGGEDKKDGEH